MFHPITESDFIWLFSSSGNGPSFAVVRSRRTGSGPGGTSLCWVSTRWRNIKTMDENYLELVCPAELWVHHARRYSGPAIRTGPDQQRAGGAGAAAAGDPPLREDVAAAGKEHPSQVNRQTFALAVKLGQNHRCPANLPPMDIARIVTDTTTQRWSRRRFMGAAVSVAALGSFATACGNGADQSASAPASGAPASPPRGTSASPGSTPATSGVDADLIRQRYEGLRPFAPAPAPPPSSRSR